MSVDLSLAATTIINSDHPSVQEFVADHKGDSPVLLEQAIALYYAVRDLIRYDPYSFKLDADSFKASETLAAGAGWCVPKAILYAACCRLIGVPAKLGFADVRNHLSTANMRAMMQTDVFYWHGYTSVFLQGQWVKATPAFNVELCEKFRLKPLEFNGKEDSIYHAFDLDGREHMEYLNDRGTFDDLPVETMFADFERYYPAMVGQTKFGDFDREVEEETSGLSGTN